MAFSSMTITFTNDWVIGDAFSVLANGGDIVGFYPAEVVATRTTTGEVTEGTPTATAGERMAINYKVAFDLDNPTGYTTVQTTNEIEITSTTQDELFVGVLEALDNVGTMTVVYNNAIPEPDPVTIGYALTRSPHLINIPFVFDTTISATIDLYIWDGDLLLDVPATPTYTFTKVRPSVDYEEFNADISEVIREQLNPTPNIVTTSPTQIVDSNTDGVKWVKYIVTYNDDENSIADIEGTFASIDGYGYYNEGVNPTKPTDNVLTSVVYRKVNREDAILFPFVNNGTITTIDIDSDLGTINATETMVNTDESTEAIQYISVDTSLALTDEYITIATQPAGDEIVYELIDECRYNPKTVYFKNKYGVYDQLAMFKKSSTKMNVDSDVFVNNYISNGTYDTIVHQFKDLNIQAKESITLNSGYITESENELYKQMLLSDKIFFYESGAFVPINIKTKSIEYKTRVNDRLVNYTMEFDYSYNTIQNV